MDATDDIDPRYHFEMLPPRGVDHFYRAAVACGFTKKAGAVGVANRPHGTHRIIDDEARARYYTPIQSPTPEDIAEACREIQAEWSVEERERRTCGAFRVLRVVVPGDR